MGSAVLNRRMLLIGRMLVSYRTSGSLNRPLAALTSGARAPFLKKPFGALRIILKQSAALVRRRIGLHMRL